MPKRSTRNLALGLFAAGVLAFAASSQSASSAPAPPVFLFPWQDGVAWQTGIAGFHGANDAIDFFPPDTPFNSPLRCVGDEDWVLEVSAYWVLASAGGVVEHADDAFVLIAHGDGWYSRYYHISGYAVSEGETVVAGQRLGHPSTAGACAAGAHVHFWVTGPDSATTRQVELSGRPTTTLAAAEWIAETGNYDVAGPGPSPTPDSTPDSETPTVPTDTPSPTPTPTPEPTPTPPPADTPPPVTEAPVFARGDANCDGSVSLADTITVMRFLAGVEESKCLYATAEVDCDGMVTVSDVVRLLRESAGVAREPNSLCIPATPRPTDEGGPPASA